MGPGLLAAAVCGDVFASPPAEAILAAIRAVCSAAGCLLIATNYTGGPGRSFHSAVGSSCSRRLADSTCRSGIGEVGLEWMIWLC